MLKRALGLVAGLCLTASLAFADPENTLMIEVKGQSNGVVEIELLPDVAPQHVERIKQLAREGTYDGIVFHRVIEGFMAQTGDVKHGKKDEYFLRYAGRGASDYPNLPAEFSDIPYVEGTVGMARSQSPNSGNSQFFIMFGPAPSLNGQYTVFGRVSSGQDVVNAIRKGSPSNNGAVAEPDYMERVWIKADE